MSGGPTVPQPTHHAYRRWRQRADDVRVGPRVAWVDGTTLPEPHGCDADEVRYYPPARAVLLRKDAAIVTVLDADRLADQQTRTAVARVRGFAAPDGGGSA